MLTNFEKLFQLDFKHDYFNSSKPASFIKLGPTILNGSPDVQLKETENGCLVYRSKPPKVTTHSPQPPEFLSLCLPITFTDPNFFNYTEIDYSPQSVLYFSTDQATQTKDGIDISLRSIGGIIQSKNAINIALQPSRFNYPMDLASLKELTSVSLTHPNGDIQELPLPVAPYQNGYPINLNGEIAGKYELQLNFKEEGQNITYLFFASDHFHLASPPAIFECKLNIESSATNTKTPSYTLSFESRYTYWRYVFPNFTEEEWNSKKIDSIEINNQTIVFQDTEQSIKLPNGQLTYAVLSSKPIPLMERPTWQVKLSTKRLSEGIILPYPQPINLTKNPAESGAIQEGAEIYISDIFCYV